MSYRLKFDEPVDKGWRRIVHEQIDTAIARLASGEDVATAVHETRKSMKRIRALLKLLRTGLSKEDYQRENRRFAEIGRMLSDARDTAVLIATANDLAQRTKGRPRTVALAMADDARIRIAASLKAEGARKAPLRNSKAGDGRIADAIAALKRARRAVDKLKLSNSSFSIIRRGLSKSYRMGRQAMERAYEDSQDEDFHEWRKAVQAHWRHMALMSRAWPDLFAARMELAKEMSDLLGLDHDLYVLIGAVNERASGGQDGAGTDGLIKVAVSRQKAIREELRAKGAALYAEETDVFVSRMESYWAAAKAARKQKRKAARQARQDVTAPRRSNGSKKTSANRKKPATKATSARARGGMIARRKVPR